MTKTVDIVVVNWNAGRQLADCLASIAAGASVHQQIQRLVVVDNHSTDQSLEHLSDQGFSPTLIRNETNRGFAAACNQGAQGSSADFLLFLNPDTVVGPDTLDRCVAYLDDEAHDRVALLGVQLVDEDGQVARTCARKPSLKNFLWPMTGADLISPRRFPGVVRKEWDHATNQPVDHVMGAFFLTRRAVFEQLQGFDERYFVYLEDLDFAVRLKEAGRTAHYLADVPVFHRGCGTSDQVRAERLSYALESRVRYAYRHFSRVSAVTHLVATYGLELPVRLIRALTGREPAAEILRGYGLLTKALFRKGLRPSSEIAARRQDAPGPPP